MSNETFVWNPASVTYVNSTWIQHILLIALNTSSISNLQEHGSYRKGSLSGCISFGRNHRSSESHSPQDPLPSKIYVTDMIVRIILIEARQFTQFTDQTKLLEHEVGEWIDSYHKDARIYCTNSLRFSQDFYRSHVHSDLGIDTDKPAIPYAREIQLVLGVAFCVVLAVCLLVAFALRLRSFIRRQMAHRKSQRTDRDSNSRVHFAYDVGETDTLTKPPIPGVTFGSNVYPNSQLTNPRVRQTNLLLTGRNATRLNSHKNYGWDRYHANGFHNRPYNQTDRVDPYGFQSRRVHTLTPMNGIASGEPCNLIIHSTNGYDPRIKRTPIHCTRFLIPGKMTSKPPPHRRGSI